jgi:mono/diheme cytochrome c family protein
MKKHLIIFILLLFATPALAIFDGKAIYNANCAGCHGANGNVQTEKARALKMDVRKLALKASKKNKEEMTAIIENGKGAMPNFKNELSKEQTRAIILYIMALRKLPGR